MLVVTKTQSAHTILLSFLPIDHCISLVIKQFGGHVASTYIPDDIEFINMAIQASRPDGNPPVPIWITTEKKTVCVLAG